MSTLSDIHVHPLRWFGLRNLPGIPLEFDELLDTALKLAKRDLDMKPAKAGLTNEYTIGGSSATAREFLYGETLENRLATALEHLCDFLERKPRQVKGALLGTLAGKGDFLESIEESSELTKKSLDTADQWSISLTNYENT